MPTERRKLVAGGDGEVRIGADPAIVTNPRVLEFHRYWLARRGGRRFPSRRDIEPTDIPHLLPGILLLDVRYDPLDFEYRLLGDDVVMRFGSLKGKLVRTAALINLSSSAYSNYCEVVETGVPQFLEGRATGAYHQGRPSVISRVHCPLSADGDSVDKIISYVAFLDK
jgi:PAS domain